MTRAPGFHLLIITAYLASTAEPFAALLRVEDLFPQLSKIERRWIGNWRNLVGEEGPT